MSADHHWVEDLFPPVFTIDSNDVTTPAEGDDLQPGADVYQLAARRISRYDPETIRNVYERVWLLNAVQDRERARRDRAQAEKEQKEVEEAAESHRKQQAADPTRTLVLDALRLTDRTSRPSVDTEDSQLWSSEELGVLREVFGATRKENNRLRAALTEYQQRVEKLEKRCGEQTEALSDKDGVLTEAKKANARLQLLIRSLKMELIEMEKDNGEVRDDLEDLREQKSDVDTQLSTLRKESSAERIRGENLKIDLENCQQAAARSLELHEERLVARFSHQVSGLQKQIDELKAELEQERKDHARSRKGLEHLQKHFSALPLQSVEKKRTMVTENQLSNWTY